ncbi:MAG: deoxyribodipyrimidine photolyase, partial [Myxococcota bacterium]|nr:deoxyribodipyrimidine photolyase [Myxococcota bacterium]
FVLYWMISNRRLEWNFSLQHAVEQANRLNKPLVILEALRCDYRWSSDRMHTFIIQGMVDNQKDAQEKSICYYPYIEPRKGHGKGLLQALSQRACLVVTDYFPCFFLPQMVRAALKVVDVRLDSVDSNGIYPLAHANRDFTTAASFRRHLQKSILPFIQDLPKPNPLADLKNRAVSLEDIQERWPATSPSQRLADGLATLPIDHSVPAVSKRGGRETAKRVAREFISSKIDRYHSDRNRLEKGAASGLSPYFHFGHLSVHELVSHIVKKENWSVKSVAPRPNGSREGWWGMSKGAEALMDELITWRELGYVFCHRHLDDYDKLSSLPEWAKKTIAEHKDDVRPVTYTLQELEAAQTHDPVWNSAQRQLLREGIIHNYMRMLWGKKIYEWSKSAEEARNNLIELNNKYAIDGRNPNSYSGIFWIMGRFDRAWGPVRPVMGKLRYMSSDSTRRKLKTKAYEARYKPDAQIRLFEKLDS